MTYQLPVEVFAEQLDRLLDLPFYREWLGDHDVDPDALGSTAAFRELPLLSREDVLDDVEDAPRFGDLYHPATSMVGFTPTGARGLMPEYQTQWDLSASAEALADLYAKAGVEAGDVVLNTFSYHYFGAAHVFHRAVTELGATVIPAGPGESDRAVSVVNDYDVDVLVSNPSFALELAKRGVPSVDLLIATGEPFSVIPGYRDEVKRAFDGDVTAVDAFGLSEALPVAVECEQEHGFHLATDYVYAEVVDPETGDVLDPGERGELVLTHLKKESMPLLRYRTGDLTTIERTTCDGDELLSLPRGIFGRVDTMTKVKGVKLFPDEIGPLVAAVDGLTGEYQVVVSREGGTDRLTLVCEGDADSQRVREVVEAEIIQSIDEVRLVPELDATETLVDERRQ